MEFRFSKHICRMQYLANALNPDELLIEYYIPYQLLHPARELIIMTATRNKNTMNVYEFPLSGDMADGNLMANSHWI